jgi:hypothetical protein
VAVSLAAEDLTESEFLARAFFVKFFSTCPEGQIPPPAPPPNPRCFRFGHFRFPLIY